MAVPELVDFQVNCLSSFEVVRSDTRKIKSTARASGKQQQSRNCDHGNQTNVYQSERYKELTSLQTGSQTFDRNLLLNCLLEFPPNGNEPLKLLKSYQYPK